MFRFVVLGLMTVYILILYAIAKRIQRREASNRRPPKDHQATA